MAELSNHDPYVDTLLTQVLIGYSNPLYLADSLSPMVPVKFQTGFIPGFVQSDWFRNTAGIRAVGTRSRRGAFTLDNTMTYACKWASFGVELPDLVRDNQMEPYNLDNACTEFAGDKILMERELSFVASAFTTGVWTGDQTGVAGAPAANQFTQWSDYGSSTPLIDLSANNDTIEGRIGREGNKFVMGKQVWTQLKWHPDLLDNIKYTQRAQMTPELLAAMLEIESVKVGRGIYTTAAEGTTEANVTYTRIWGKNALLLYTPDSPQLMVPAGMYTISWARVANALSYTRRMRDDQAEIDIFEANAFYMHKVTVPRAGVFLSSAVA